MKNSKTAKTQGMALHTKLHGEMALSATFGGLRYVQDGQAGIRRVPHGKKFRYIDVNGKPLTDKNALARIKALAIPPAWTEVWICPNPAGHLQATGRDAKGRKQYRYHAQWRAVRDTVKYAHMIDFGLHLPLIRDQVMTDMRSPQLSKRKVVATVVYLLEKTMIRIGNEAYAKENKSYGLTTLHNRHVAVEGNAIEFHFRGKSRVEHHVRIQDPRLARIIRQIRDLPGQELFQYLDDEGQRHAIDSSDVNDYLKEITGKDYTAKDFRTWAGTVHTTLALSALKYETQTEAKKNVIQAIEMAARKLGNTPTICRKCYVHPAVIDSYLAGELLILQQAAETGAGPDSMADAERHILKLLKRAMAAA
jgi:DNA topoisomerase-1